MFVVDITCLVFSGWVSIISIDSKHNQCFEIINFYQIDLYTS